MAGERSWRMGSPVPGGTAGDCSAADQHRSVVDWLGGPEQRRHLDRRRPQRLPGVIDDIVDVDHVENLSGGLVTPGLIDAHTHPVYAGNRWAELAMRSNGSSAAEIN